MDNATEWMSGVNPPTEAERLKQDVEHLQRKLDAMTVDRDKYKNELENLRRNMGIDKCEQIFCADPACSTNNPRT